MSLPDDFADARLGPPYREQLSSKKGTADGENASSSKKTKHASQSIHYRRRIAGIDGVRALAAIGVVLHHYVLYEMVIGNRGEQFAPDATWLPLYLFRCGAYLGWMGVDLFFALSGFLITGILLDTKTETASRREFFLTFFARRGLRIMPVYYTFLVGYSVIHAAAGESDPNQLYHWLYASNVLVATSGWDACTRYTQHLWTLSIEEQFYFVWPLVVYFTDRGRLMKLVIAVVTAVPFLRWYAAEHSVLGPDGAFHILTIARADVLLWGALLALLARDKRWFDRLRRHAPAAALLFAGSYIAMLFWRTATLFPSAAPTAFHFYLLSEEDPIMQGLGYPLTTTAFVSLIATLVTRPAGRLARWLHAPGLRGLGRISYAFYIIQTPVIVWGFSSGSLDSALRALGASGLSASVIGIFLAIGISAGAAWLSWRWLETPILKLKSRFDVRARSLDGTGGVAQ